jgi:general nucleoside transport system ATP-binding protein
VSRETFQIDGSARAYVTEVERVGARPALSLRGISKTFGNVVAADDVSLDIRAGAVLGLLGENGAGKTTLMNILSGVYLPESGSIEVDGKPLPFGSPKASIQAGIGMVHQHLKLVETLTGAENIALAVRGGFLKPKRLPPEVDALQKDLGFDLDLQARVWQLPMAARQQLEILRILATGCTLLILDEPTAVLSPLETRSLFSIIRKIAESGRAVVLISHKLNEVLSVADHVAVMRGGRVVFESRAHDTDVRMLAGHMLGEREVRQATRPKAVRGERVLAVEELVVRNDLDLEVVHGVSFEVCAGELVAIVGVAGNGQTELMEAIGSLRKPEAGRIEVPLSPNGARRMFAHIPAERLGVGLAPGLAVRDNALLGHHRRSPFSWWLSRREVERHAGAVLEQFSVRASGDHPVSYLSGGNLQRVVLGRELLRDHRLMLASYPTRGLDVASAAQIRAALVQNVANGGAVLFASEELSESFDIATRMLVMYRGGIVADVDPESVTVEEIGRLITTGRSQ